MHPIQEGQGLGSVPSVSPQPDPLGRPSLSCSLLSPGPWGSLTLTFTLLPLVNTPSQALCLSPLLMGLSSDYHLAPNRIYNRRKEGKKKGRKLLPNL